MLKGHLQIELKNEDTGEVETYEETNMVTNAISNVLGIAANVGYNASYELMEYTLPIATKGLGGLFLFDGTLEENEDNIHFPMDVHMIGSAGQTSTTNTKYIGSINNEESIKSDNGYTKVWDFTTSQANGTIASLALTHYKCGDNPLGCNYVYHGSFEISHNYVPVAFNVETETAYFYEAYSGKIYSKKIYSHLIKVNSPVFGEEKEVFNFNWGTSEYTKWEVSNGYDGYIYAVYTPSLYQKGTATIRIRKVKVSDWSFDEQEEQTFNLENVTLCATANRDYKLDYTCVVSKGYLYILSYNKKILYKINLSNVADVKELTFGDAKCSYIYPKYNGGLYASFVWNGTSSSGTTVEYTGAGLIYPDGKYMYKEESTSQSKYGAIDPYSTLGFEVDDLLMLVVAGNGYTMYHAYASNYLGTICNLSSPVTKTSAQTMKVTYTLTDE